ncbi:MAG: two component transcriptional regulator, winged helix family [Thermoleophilia bacterium]|nr:two component transcriptional regulator, winged helix family [Thermoleophilia bacterium]
MLTPDRPIVLVVDDEPNIRSFLGENLVNDDFTVHAAASISQARSRLEAHRPALVLLDVGLPDGNGFDFCREIRRADPLLVRFDPNVPVIMLTARTEEVDRVRGFQRGADDFVAKPFHYPELLARIHAILRRSTERNDREVLQVAGINLDMRSREVRVHGTRVELSSKEFLLLAALAAEPRKVFRKQELLESVWGFRSMGSTRTLDSHASRLRRKLRPLGEGRAYIGNVWGVGYRLVALETEA